MDDEDLLFTNEFVTQIDDDDIPFSQKANFRMYHEKQLHDRDVERRSTRSISLHSDTGRENTDKPDQHFSESSRKMPGPATKKIERKTIINVDSRNRDVNKYPFQHDFEVFLGKTFFNVKTIQLVSTEFPNTDKVIKDTPPPIQNNIITWQNEEDSDLGFFDGVELHTEPTRPNTVDLTIPNHRLAIGLELAILIYNS